MSGCTTPRIALIGFGAAGQAIASGLRESGIGRIAARDILLPHAAAAPLTAAGERLSVHNAASAAEAVARPASSCPRSPPPPALPRSAFPDRGGYC